MTKIIKDQDIREVEDLYGKPVLTENKVFFPVYNEIEVKDGKMIHSCVGYHHPSDFSDFLVCLNNLLYPISMQEFNDCNFKETVKNFTMERVAKDKNLTVPVIENFVKNCRNCRDIIVSNYDKEKGKEIKANEIINELL